MSLRPLYLDWNATTPPYPEVAQAMHEALSSTWGNPSSVHGTGRRARAVVESLREALGRALGAEPRSVFLTSGGTEANNLALHQAPGLVTSRLEHPSVTRVAEALEREGRPVRWLSVPRSGRLDPESLEGAARDLPPGSVLTVQAANHETGVVQPVAELADRARRLGLVLHVDAAQGFGKVEKLELAGARSVAVSAHKIRGPKGIGALVFRAGVPPKPILMGGEQERGVRPGTLEPALAAGFLAALELSERDLSWKRLGPLRDQLERALCVRGQVNGEGPRLPHVTNLSFGEARGDELVAALDLLGIQVSSGSACSAGTAEPSPVVTAMLGRARARSAIRISLGEDFGSADVERVARALIQVLERSAPGTLA